MKKLLCILLFVLLISVFPVSADEPADAQTDDLAAVQESGILRMGTSPEYIPFVFYDDEGNLTGIDVALMEEIGRRMNVKVQAVDIAFDGLIDSLDMDQVDVIGGGFSKTDSRAEQIDFTRVYYNGEAEFIALASLPKPDSIELANFREYKIGVQKGTSFDQWVKTNLVTAGYVSSKNVYAYSGVQDAMAALDRGDVDLVLMDEDIFEDYYQPTGNYQLFYEDFAKENYAFGLRKDSTLTAVIDQHLTEMIKDGTAQSIADRFFKMDYSEAESGIIRPGQLPTPTPMIPVIIPTYAPVSCTNGMVFVADVTIPDGTVLYPGQQFQKIWRVENTGTCTWTPDYMFIFVSGDQMNAQYINIPAVVAPGQTADLAVNLTAPWYNGSYKGNWQMRAPQGTNFGQTVWVNIVVNDGTQPTQPVYPTPVPTHATGLIVPVNILAFYPDYYSGYVGDCINVYWNTENAYSITVNADGMTVYSGDAESGSQYICDPVSSVGSHTIEIYASNDTDNAYSSFIYTASYATGLITPEPEHPTGLITPVPEEDDYATGFLPN